MVTKLVVGLAIALALSLGALGHTVRTHWAAESRWESERDGLLASIQRARNDRKRAEATLASLRQKNAATARAGASAAASLSAASAAAPSWAAEPVPKGVQDALSQ